MATIAYRRIEGEYEYNPFGSNPAHIYHDDICMVNVETTAEAWRAIERIQDQEWESEWVDEWYPTTDGEGISESYKEFTSVKIIGLYGELSNGESLEVYCKEMQLV